MYDNLLALVPVQRRSRRVRAGKGAALRAAGVMFDIAWAATQAPERPGKAGR
jgi:hypothetical protein